jgi:hypothetical protein
MKNVLTASGSSSFPTVAYGDRTLNELELMSVQALVAYVANDQTVSDVTVGAMVGAKFNAADVTGLRRKDYDEVIKFLIDLKIRETLN